jgi:hypothetical protein
MLLLRMALTIDLDCEFFASTFLGLLTNMAALVSTAAKVR